MSSYDDSALVSLDGINSTGSLLKHRDNLILHFRKHNDGELNQAWAKNMIRALALQARTYLLPKEHVELVDECLFPYARRLSRPYRVGFDIALVLQLLEVAGQSFTKLERGWRRLHVARIALEDGPDCKEDPERHFAAAIRLAEECHHQIGGDKLMRAVIELSEQYKLPLVIDSSRDPDLL